MTEGETRERTWPVKLAWLSVEKEQFAPGEVINFEVELEALEATDIPWSTSPIPISSGSVGYKSMIVGLSVGEGKDFQALASGVRIEGIASHEASLLHLEKGQRARIRASSAWRLDGSESALVSAAVHAGIMPVEGELILDPILSSNTRHLRTIERP